MNGYRLRIMDHVRPMLQESAPVERALDFGSGDGWFAQQFGERGLARAVVPVDVLERRRVFVKPQLYDGRRLPFADGSFDLVYSMDVLHHCDDPEATLADLVRCSRRYVLIKDHTYRGWPGRVTLSILDELGNRRFGVPSVYHYQHRWSWLPFLERAGFRQVRLIHPLPCARGPLGWATNRLQFLGLWSRDGEKSADPPR